MITYDKQRPAHEKTRASAATISSLWRLATAGKSRAEAAQELGISYGHVAMASRLYRIPFRHGKTVEKPRHRRQRQPIGRVKAAGLIDELPFPQRIDFVTLVRKGGYQPADAFAALKRPDLAARAEELEKTA